MGSREGVPAPGEGLAGSQALPNPPLSHGHHPRAYAPRRWANALFAS